MCMLQHQSYGTEIQFDLLRVSLFACSHLFTCMPLLPIEFGTHAFTVQFYSFHRAFEINRNRVPMHLASAPAPIQYRYRILYHVELNWIGFIKFNLIKIKWERKKKSRNAEKKIAFKGIGWIETFDMWWCVCVCVVICPRLRLIVSTECCCYFLLLDRERIQLCNGHSHFSLYTSVRLCSVCPPHSLGHGADDLLSATSFISQFVANANKQKTIWCFTAHFASHSHTFQFIQLRFLFISNQNTLGCCCFLLKLLTHK